MSDRGMDQRLLDVIPLAKSLTPADLDALKADFPEFEIRQLLDKAGEMGDAPPLEKDGSAARKLRVLKFELQLARRALDRVLPECERACKVIGAKLQSAARNEFYASVLALLGGGGAVTGGAVSKLEPTVLSGILAIVASLFTLYSQRQRKSLNDDVSLAKVYGTLAEARGTMRQLKDTLDLYASSTEELLTDSEPKVFENVKRTLEVTTTVEGSLSSVAPLVEGVSAS